MSTILLQLESALADARVAQEKAAEKLHDTGVQHALAKSQYDAATDAVKRVEGALNSMHGVAAAPSAPVVTQSAVEKPRRAPKPAVEGPQCPSCHAVGTLTMTMRGTVKFAVCSECNGEHQAA